LADELDYLLEREMKHHVEMLGDSVLKGNASDWGDYKYLVGQIIGIQFCLRTLVDLRQRTNPDPDGDEQ
jgi:hypothetical protein